MDIHPSDTSVSHIAGPAIHIRGRVIQRCVVCGAKLIDSRMPAIQFFPMHFALHMPGSMVREDHGNYESVPFEEQGTAGYGVDGCVVLVEEESR